MVRNRTVEDSVIEDLFNKLNSTLKCVDDISVKVPVIYNNKEVCGLLGISSKLLVRYRSQGLLPYHRCDDKYWYTQSDVDSFIKNTRC